MTQVEQIARILQKLSVMSPHHCEKTATAIHTEVIRPLVERGAALREFVGHKPDCDSQHPLRDFPCNCGFDIFARTTLSLEPQG